MLTNVRPTCSPEHFNEIKFRMDFRIKNNSIYTPQQFRLTKAYVRKNQIVLRATYELRLILFGEQKDLFPGVLYEFIFTSRIPIPWSAQRVPSGVSSQPSGNLQILFNTSLRLSRFARRGLQPRRVVILWIIISHQCNGSWMENFEYFQHLRRLLIKMLICKVSVLVCSWILFLSWSAMQTLDKTLQIPLEGVTILDIDREKQRP